MALHLHHQIITLGSSLSLTFVGVRISNEFIRKENRIENRTLSAIFSKNFINSFYSYNFVDALQFISFSSFLLEYGNPGGMDAGGADFDSGKYFSVIRI